ncbi:hypothetical protein BH09PLA1_BH09PLA1_22000 [soil metagenome]
MTGQTIRAEQNDTVRPQMRKATSAIALLLGLMFALANAGCAGFVDAGFAQPASGSDGAVATNSVGMKFVFVPPGKFVMGSPITEARREMDEVEHKVQLTNGFYLGQTEVTRAQFAKFVRESKYVTEAERAGDLETWRNLSMGQKFDHPVVYVTWHDAQAFCEWLSAREGRTYRLPTEAEWEYAARAGTRDPFANGASIGTGDANFNGTTRYGAGTVGSYRATTVAVRGFEPNPWGLHDMCGNVWEWCSDWYGRYPIEPTINPQGPSTGSVKLARGGSWANAPEYCRAAYRFGGNPEASYSTVGFRCVMEASGRGAPVPVAPQDDSTATASTGRD